MNIVARGVSAISSDAIPFVDPQILYRFRKTDLLTISDNILNEKVQIIITKYLQNRLLFV